MSTIIFPSPVFGPIKSRRLGVSLGVNLMPSDGKLCTFDCIYCECGFNADRRPARPRPTALDVHNALKRELGLMLERNEQPDVITFAGNGEPTAHPDFLSIVKDTIAMRNYFFPKAMISVLTNGTLIHRPKVFEALQLVDNNIVKLDTVDIDYIRQVNRPLLYYSVDDQVRNMAEFKGHIVIQTMFMKAVLNGVLVNNADDQYVDSWLRAIRYIQPREVMIYTIDRETPDLSLQKSSPEELDRIVDLVRAEGIKASASY